MEKHKTDEQSPEEDRPESESGHGSLKSRGEVVVTYQPEATKAPEWKHIHQRRPMRPVPEGDDVPDRGSSDPVNVETPTPLDED
jgi:hypothetical protein